MLRARAPPGGSADVSHENVVGHGRGGSGGWLGPEATVALANIDLASAPNIALAALVCPRRLIAPRSSTLTPSTMAIGNFFSWRWCCRSSPSTACANPESADPGPFHPNSSAFRVVGARVWRKRILRWAV